MSSDAPEWSEIVQAREVAGPTVRHIVADAPARERLARRFGIIAIEALSADVTVRPIAGGLGVSGTIDARVVQSCAATGRDLRATITDRFALDYVRDLRLVDTVDEDGLTGVEIDADMADRLPLEAERVDIAEAAAQSLALAIDPFARHPDADAMLAAAGVRSETEAAAASGPFAALAGLRSGGAA